MSEVALSLFKKHVRADDFSDDDDYLQQCLDAAEASVVRETNRTLDELKLMGGGSLPAPLVQAILLVGGSAYDHRENDAPQQYSEIPWGASAIIKQYRRLCVREE